jgi:predicted glycogen debranching enzyme
LDVIILELPKIDLKKKVLSDLNYSLGKEWLVTNGLGGYASSTVLGLNTRKYHGLLVVALNPPINRWVLLSKIDETLQIGKEHYSLGTNEFKDVIYPEGYNYLSEFVIDPFPTFKYNIQGISFHKTVFMPYLKNATVVMYEVLNSTNKEVTVNLSPLINSRHMYTTTDKTKIDWNFSCKSYGKSTVIEPSDSLSSIIMFSSKYGTFVDQSWWVEKIFFRVDSLRGESDTDDCFRPGFFRFSINPLEKRKFHFLAVAGKNKIEAQNTFSSLKNRMEDVDLLYIEELERRKNLLEQFQKHNCEIRVKNWLKWLVQAVDSFIVSRASIQKKSVIAGYHWFDDWGRDSLISLPGLTLVTGRFKDAKEILLTFEHYCSKGIIPNRFSDKAGDVPLYNTVDATLWFFNAILQYLKYTGDFVFIKDKLWNTLNKIIDYHIQGTIFGIHMDKDGLIAHGPQLTWMDATTFDNFVTPRNGKAVEIQALWYNALKIMELLSRHFKQAEKTIQFQNMAQKTKQSFIKKFWDPRNEYLFDVINNNEYDSTLRPNQLISISLDFPLVNIQKSKKIVEIIWKHLWGTYGLKTLPESDLKYIGTYLGNWEHRDKAYHNGSVWPWLLGPFITAFLKTKSHEKYWRNFAFKNFLEPLFQTQLYQAGLGTISELYDGSKPNIPRGCISQAWSIAEPLRVYIEDIMLNKPPFEKTILNNVE